MTPQIESRKNAAPEKRQLSHLHSWRGRKPSETDFQSPSWTLLPWLQAPQASNWGIDGQFARRLSASRCQDVIGVEWRGECAISAASRLAGGGDGTAEQSARCGRKLAVKWRRWLVRRAEPQSVCRAVDHSRTRSWVHFLFARWPQQTQLCFHSFVFCAGGANVSALPRCDGDGRTQGCVSCTESPFFLPGGCLLPVSGYLRDRAVIGSDVQHFH